MQAVELVILIGIQACGKTTFFRRRLQGRYAHVSLDNWRGKGNARARERRAVVSGLHAAAEGHGGIRGVVVDNTNITAETRRRYFGYAAECARQAGCQVRVVAYFFQAELSDCLERNAQRPKDAPCGVPYYVPPSAIRSFHSRLEPPSYEEGFHEIFRVRICEDGRFAVEGVPHVQEQQ